MPAALPRRAAAPALALLLAACSGPSEPVTAAPAATPPASDPAPIFAVVYRCPDGTVFTTFTRGDSAQVDYAGHPAAAGEVVTAECEGTEARDVWEAARLRGVVLRAGGNEPGWLLEITPGRQLVFAWDYGAQRVNAPAPAAATGPQGTTRYTATTAQGPLELVVREGNCSDGMSETAWPASATVTLGDRTFSGCARPL